MRFSLCTWTKKKNPQLGLICLEYLQIFKSSCNNFGEQRDMNKMIESGFCLFSLPIIVLYTPQMKLLHPLQIKLFIHDSNRICLLD